MTFKFECPHCGQRIAASVNDVGTIGVCQTCGQEFTVPSPPTDNSVKSIDDLLGRSRSDQPPPHHYLFVHQALRQVAFANPEHEVGFLRSPEGHRLIESLWNQVCARRSEPADVSADQIKVHACWAALFPCALIEMPAPRDDTEAYFVALVLRRFGLPGGAVAAFQPALLYYTLEKGKGRHWEDVTMFCEWTEGGMHKNLGYGPTSSIEAFMDVVSKRVDESIK